jgi:hypothetical protein
MCQQLERRGAQACGGEVDSVVLFQFVWLPGYVRTLPL